MTVKKDAGMTLLTTAARLVALSLLLSNPACRQKSTVPAPVCCPPGGVHNLILIIEPCPRGDQLALVVLRGERPDDIESQLWILSVDSRRHRETAGWVLPGLERRPVAWAPNGSKLLYVGGMQNNSTGIYLVTTEDLTVAWFAGDSDYAPMFSPDGRYVGFGHSQRFRSFKLVVVELSSRGRQTICDDVETMYHWCWQHDSSGVFYIRGGSIYRWDVATGKKRVVWAPEPAEGWVPIMHLASSPDGSRLGFYRGESYYAVGLEDGAVEKLFDCPDRRSDFHWSESGICYLEKAPGEDQRQRQLMVYRPGAERPEIVAKGVFTAAPRWLGASRIAVGKNRTEIWVYDIRSMTGQRIFVAE